jgi:hypothetical protein
MAEHIAESVATEAKPPRSREKKKKSKRKQRTKTAKGTAKRGVPLGYPKHPVLKCLRIPQAVLENNAGKECTDREAAKFASIGWSGQIAVEISSAIKYGLFERPSPGKLKPTDITRHSLQPTLCN